MARDPNGRKELQAPGTKLPALVDLSKIDALIAESRAVVAERKQLLSRAVPSPSPVPVVPVPSAAPTVERVRVPAYCSTYGRPNIIIAERHGNQLRFVGSEPVGAGGRGGGEPPAMLSGSYELDFAGWSCPHCRRTAIWSCFCAAFQGVLHCTDLRRGLHHCACGKREERHFQRAETFEVRGSAGATVAGPGRPGQALVPRKGR